MDTNVFGSLRWRLVGPHRGGRVVAVAGHPNEIGTFYFGACAGGVWKTTNGGSHWENISDGYFKTSAVGAIAVSDSDPNVIYVGMGETAIRSNVSHGDGVYKSTDGGRTWTNVGLADTRYIGEIQIHPKNPDIVFVGALGHVWGQNDQRGVYRSVDGGQSWELVLYKSPRAGAVDISLDPSNPRVIFATIWQGQRYPHTAVSGGEDSGLWRSMDGGDTWEDISENTGLPSGNWGKSGVAVSPARSGRVWAQIEAEEHGVFRSDDYGETWKRVNDNLDLGRRPWYYMHIYADPTDADTLWVLNLQCWKSIDGGVSFSQVPTPHGDNHDLWIDPRNPRRMIEGNDGGACVSYDGGATWSSILNQPTAQFYHVEVDDAFPYNLYGSQQDNFAMRLPMADAEGAITWKNYYEPGGGESGYMRVQSEPPFTVFGGGIGTGLGHGRLLAWDPEQDQRRNVTAWPEVHGFGAGPETLKYRFQWTFPIEFSPHDPKTLYVCSQFVHRSNDLGHSYEIISPDLTRNDPSMLGPSGGPITLDNSGAEIYCTIFAFVESPVEAGVMWAGSDDGLIHVSRNGGVDWKNVTPPDLPEWSMISMIEASPYAAGSAWVAATNYKNNDFRPFIFHTEDFGESWSLLVNGLPDDDFVRVVREDLKRRGLMFAGTEMGVYVSFDSGATWNRMDTNLPVVPIYDLVIKDDDLIAATHGRSFWILDDISPLRQLPDKIESSAAHLFKPRDTYRYRFYGRAFGTVEDTNALNYMMIGPVTISYRVVYDESGVQQKEFLDAGNNPPDGVIVHYYLAQEPTEEVTLRFFDENGTEINSYSSKGEETPRVPAKAGMNRFVWDLRRLGASPLETGDQKDRRTADAEKVVAPRSTPGVYEVSLSVGDQSMSQQFRVLRDPRLKASDDDLAEQLEMKIGIRDLLSTVNGTLNQIDSIKRQLNEWYERADASEDPSVVRAACDELKEKVDAMKAELQQHDPNGSRPGPSKIREKLLALSSMIDESDDRPTAAANEFYAEIKDSVTRQQQTLRSVIDRDLPIFQERLQEANVPPIAP